MGTKIKCFNCGTVLESRFRHDFQECECENQTYVDGGNDYLRVGGLDFKKIGVWDEKIKKFVPENDFYRISNKQRLITYLKNKFKRG